MKLYHETEEGKRKITQSISSPQIGSVVTYTPRDGGNSYDVYITNGKYFSNGRVSNFWYWRKLKKDGSLVKKAECGYGSFTEIKNKYEIIITAKIIKKG